MNKINLLIKLKTEDGIDRKNITAMEELFMQHLVNEKMAEKVNNRYKITKYGQKHLSKRLTEFQSYMRL